MGPLRLAIKLQRLAELTTHREHIVIRTDARINTCSIDIVKMCFMGPLRLAIKLQRLAELTTHREHIVIRTDARINTCSRISYIIYIY